MVAPGRWSSAQTATAIPRGQIPGTRILLRASVLPNVLPGSNGKAVLRGGGAVIYGPLQYNDFGGAMDAGYTQNRTFFTNQGPTTGGAFTPAFQLDSTGGSDPTNRTAGFPNVSYAPSLDPTQLTAQGGPGNFTAVGGEVILPKNGRPSMTSNWSLQLQDELAQDLIFTMGYIGQVAQNLRSGNLSNINNISSSNFILGDRLNNPQFFHPAGRFKFWCERSLWHLPGQPGPSVAPISSVRFHPRRLLPGKSWPFFV